MGNQLPIYGCLSADQMPPLHGNLVNCRVDENNTKLALAF